MQGVSPRVYPADGHIADDFAIADRPPKQSGDSVHPSVKKIKNWIVEEQQHLHRFRGET